MSREQEFWNNPEITHYFESKPPDPRIVEFLEQMKDVQGLHALDLGCGGGRHSQLLAEKGFAVASVDVNPEMIAATEARLARNGLDADVQFGSILSIPHPDEAFDLAVTTGVLHQAKSPEEYMMALAELSRVIKKDGIVLLNIFTNAVWDETYEQYGDSDLSVVTKEGLPMTLLPKEIFNAFMAVRGFKLFDEQGEDIKEENTGPRAVYRAFYVKQGV